MTTQQWLLIALAALAVFWALGAHNRLVALRNAIVGACAQLDEPLQRRAAALRALVEALRTALPDEGSAFDAVEATQARLLAAADTLRARPALAANAAAFSAAEAASRAAQARVLALLEQHRERAGDGLAPQLASLREAEQRLDFARQLFNEAVRRHNEAVRQFPARLLAALLGFAAAGTL